MSDYYYFADKNEALGYIPILGDDYIGALKSIVNKHGIKITDKMILKEVFGKKAVSKKARGTIKKGKVGV